MLHLCLKSLAGIALALAIFSNAHAVTVYSESVSGDLSNNGLTPTAITLGLGSNEILGTTGKRPACRIATTSPSPCQQISD